MLTLVIGNKQLSSWSLRPWLLLRHLELPFREILLPLDVPQFAPAVRQYTPAGHVPILLDGDLRIWDSLAIIEYLHEKSGGRAWPAAMAHRAHARSISAEMHSGFAAMREAWPLRAASRDTSVPPTRAVAADVARIDAIWQDCRTRYAADGPWLFGAFSAADAMYAPVALRFNTYGATLSSAAAAYMRHMLTDEHIREWIAAAATELTHRS